MSITVPLYLSVCVECEEWISNTVVTHVHKAQLVDIIARRAIVQRTMLERTEPNQSLHHVIRVALACYDVTAVHTEKSSDGRGHLARGVLVVDLVAPNVVQSSSVAHQ